MKKIFPVLLSMLLIVCIFSSAVSAGKDTIRYFMWDPENVKMERELISDFEKENPDIKVELTSLEPSNYWPKISAMAAAGELPDVFNMSTGYVAQWAKDGLLLDVNEFVKRDLSSDDYFVKILPELVYPQNDEGKLYSVPFAWVTTVFYYNKDMFDQAGLSYPDDNWTWDDFLKAVQRLTVDENSDGVPETYGFWWYGRYAHVEPWIYANGGRILNENKTRIAVDEKAREALHFLANLVNKYEVSPRKKDTVGIRQQDMFPLHQAAMWVDGSWNIKNNRDIINNSFRWGIARVPKGPSVTEAEYGAYGWPDSLAIAKSSKNKEAAWKLVKFLVGKNRPADSYMAGKVPFYKGTANSEEWMEKGKQPDQKDVILKNGEKLGRTTFTIGWGEWRGYAATGGAGMNGELDKVTNGEQTMDEAIEKFTKYGNKVLARYYPNE